MHFIDVLTCVIEELRSVCQILVPEMVVADNGVCFISDESKNK